MEEGEINAELVEKQVWKERLREEILEEEKQRIRKYVDFEVNKKMLEIEKLLEIGGKPAKLVLVPVLPPSEDGTKEREVIDVVDLEGDNDGENDGLKLGLGLEKEDDGGDSKKELEIQGNGNDERYGSKLGLEKANTGEDLKKEVGIENNDNGSKLGLGFEKDDDGEDSKKELEIEGHDNGNRSYGSKLGLGLEKADNGEDSKEEQEIEGNKNGEGDHDVSDGSKLERDNDAMDTNKDDIKEKKDGLSPESTISPPQALKASSSKEKTKRPFPISETHLRPTKKQKTQILKCTICNVAATSEANLDAHFKGKKHAVKSSELKRKIASSSATRLARKGIKTEGGEKGIEIKMEVNGKMHSVFERSDGIWCEQCKWSCKTKIGMSLHLCKSEH